ncbi:hypothetical protein [Pseudomaricurvus hydrocarbonicus]|nr:hypothetical protein [Aestuariicella hydrocarbonica]
MTAEAIPLMFKIKNNGTGAENMTRWSAESVRDFRQLNRYTLGRLQL